MIKAISLPPAALDTGGRRFFLSGGTGLTDHYYSKRPQADHREHQFTALLRGMEFRFITDASVFSRERVDFGSALLIEAMRLDVTDRVLDIGCGYGPIGLVAARLVPNGKVHMVDVNERAVALAKRNAVENEIENAEVYVSDGLGAVQNLDFDTVVINPPIRAGKVTIYRMLDEAHSALRPTGSIWVVIQTKQGAPSMKKKLKELFGNVQDVEREAGYHVFRSIRA